MTARTLVVVASLLATGGCADDGDPERPDGGAAPMAQGGWTSHTFELDAELRAVWGSAPDELFAVGHADGGAVIFARDGDAFRSEALPDGAAGQLASISGSEQGGVWAVGPGLILERDAAGWQQRNRDQYLAVACSGVFVEDSGGVWITESSGSFIRFDGATWSTQPSPGGDALTAVAGHGETTWATTEAGAILRSDGGAFQVDAEPSGAPLRALWASSGPEVWAVGDAGSVVRFDGNAWEAISVPTTADLRGVSGTGPDDVWVAGDAGTLLHFDGDDFQRVDPAVQSDFTSVLALSERVVWLAGEDGTLVELDAQ